MESRADVTARLKKIVAQGLGLSEAEVTDEKTFVNDLGTDSLEAVEIVMEIENEFNIQLTDVEAESMTTVGKAVDLILEKTG